MYPLGEGHALSAGTYTFFVIPGDAEWTLILNRVPRQWGAFEVFERLLPSPDRELRIFLS